jgi:hypothetical protein
MSTLMIGVGDVQHSFINVYIANRPPLDEYSHLNELKPLTEHDITSIAQQTGNHWRKIFNVFAKFMFSYFTKQEIELDMSSWQNYRDQKLLQAGSGQRLLFTKPNLDEDVVHLIMGKQYAILLGYHEDIHKGMIRVDNDFVIWPQKKLIICPYFDYRQLSNIKIDRLIDLVISINNVK